MKKLLFIPILLLAWSPSWAEAPEKDQLEQATKAQSQNDKEAKASQEKVTQIATEIRSLTDDYRLVNRRIDNTKIYNQQLRDLIRSQKEEMASIKKQIQGLKNTNQEILPLMARMLENLEKFISLDIPFLPDERKNRLTALKAMMSRADVSTSEKYRRLLEAYQVENEYGRTIEAYKGIQEHDGKELTVDFLRVGRLNLIYQSVDRTKSGYWNRHKQRWVSLPGTYSKTIRKGIRIARKQLAPDLIKLPIPAPEVAK